MENVLLEKFDDLTRAILEDSQAETEKILNEVREKREAAKTAGIAALKEEVALYKKTKLTEMRRTQARRITLTMIENKRELVRLRAEYSEKVFSLLRERISAFTETPQYLDKLRQYLSRGLSEIGEGCETIVLLRKADMRFTEELKDSAEGYDLVFEDGAFEVGGLMLSCRLKRVSIDMTYDTELRDLGGHFAEMFGLELE